MITPKRSTRRFLLAALAGATLIFSAASAQNVTVAITSIGNTLDAAVANFTNTTVAMDHVYDRIINFDENFEFIPGVAESWEFTGPTTFAFNVADGFVFHNGDALTLDDVVFSIERLRENPRLASVMGNISSTEISGDREITVNLKEENSTTIRELMAEAHVLNEAYSTGGADYVNEPVGTGPFTVTRFVPGDRLELSAWADHPGGAPAIDGITFRTIEEDGNRYIAVETGEAQLATISYHDLQRAENNPRLEVIEQKTTNTAFISMNTQKAPFDNVNVRRAMAFATDREGLATIQGGSTPIDSMTPDMFITYHSAAEAPGFDLEEARRLLEVEGYGPGHPLEFEAWIYGGNSSVMETYQALLRAIGVEMSIRSLEFGVFLEGMARGDYQMLAGSWNNTTGDPLSALENYWSGSFGSRNISFYTNDRTDELYELALTTVDEDQLLAAAREVQEIAARDMPIIPTFSSLALYAFDAGLHGVETYPSGLFSLRNATYE